ncbi:hypothetical protein D3C80_1655530 [compost metagenome]
MSASWATFRRRLSARRVRASSMVITCFTRRRKPPEKSSLLTSPSMTTIASFCNSAWAAMNASANSDASMRPERSSRVTKPILSPFLFFITRKAMIIPATVWVSRDGLRSMMR